MYRLFALGSFGASVAWMYSAPSYEPLIAIIAAVAALLRDELHGFIGAKYVSLNPRRGVIGSLIRSRFSFTRDEFVNPLIIKDLNGWLSDVGDQVVAINIESSNKSNRYYSDGISVTDSTPSPIVSAKDGDGMFSYQYLGHSFSGIHILRVSESGEGSGVFGSIIFVTMSHDTAVELSPTSSVATERVIVKKLGGLPLGDRYDGKIAYRFGLLCIGPSSRHEAIRKVKQRLLIL